MQDRQMTVAEVMALIAEWEEKHRATLGALESHRAALGGLALNGRDAGAADELGRLQSVMVVAVAALETAKAKLAPAQRAERLALAQKLRAESADDMRLAEEAAAIIRELQPQIETAYARLKHFANVAAMKGRQADDIQGRLERGGL